MESIKPPPWYKQKRYLITITAIVGFIALSSGGSNSSTTSFQATPTISPVSQQQTTSYTPAQVTSPAVQESSNLSNNNYYTNTYGNEVHSPAYTQNNSIPAGASAQCRDGTYSFSQSRRGTCSHHGGVAEWL